MYQLVVKLDDEAEARLKALASAEGITVSDWVRRQIGGGMSSAGGLESRLTVLEEWVDRVQGGSESSLGDLERRLSRLEQMAGGS